MAPKVRQRTISFGAFHLGLWLHSDYKSSVRGPWTFCSDQMLRMPPKHPTERGSPLLSRLPFPQPNGKNTCSHSAARSEHHLTERCEWELKLIRA